MKLKCHNVSSMIKEYEFEKESNYISMIDDELDFENYVEF
jgi:hypothetical protein